MLIPGLNDYDMMLLNALLRHGDSFINIPALGYLMPRQHARYRDMRYCLDRMADMKLVVKGRMHGNIAFKLGARGKAALEVAQRDSAQP